MKIAISAKEQLSHILFELFDQLIFRKGLGGQMPSASIISFYTGRRGSAKFDMGLDDVHQKLLIN